jgi:hypothetical protein
MHHFEVVATYADGTSWEFEFDSPSSQEAVGALAKEPGFLANFTPVETIEVISPDDA